ncbi:MAG: ATP-binding cassette domain-containing protein [Alphaproteobacteria bacterium]|nr:ATP-binding cassette domain-containing protein [Alphaproteobacteria bacterium]
MFHCNLQYQFPNAETLQIEFAMKQDDILHLKGSNACGKTTVFNLINGFLTPKTGVIELNNIVLFDSRLKINIPAKNRNIGRVFQNHYLFPHMSVKKNLYFANKNSALLTYLIEQLNLQPLLKKFPRNLSGGQQQKLAIVQNLINNPQLLLLDEAFSNLDWQTKNTIKTVILDSRIPTIITTHNNEDTENFTTKTVLLG